MASLQNNIEYLSDKIQNTFNNQQGTVSMESRDISPNTLMQAQNTSIATAPHIIYQEHDMKINEMNDQALDTDLSNKIEYAVDYETKNDMKTNIPTYEQNPNGNNDHENIIDHEALESYVPEQEYNSYDQYNVIESEQQEHTDAIQNSNEVTSQYSTLDT